MAHMYVPQRRVVLNCFNVRDSFIDFKNKLKFGDTFMLTLDDMGIEQDATLPYYQECKVIKLYPYHACLEHKHKTISGNIYIHRCCLNYGKLFVLSKNTHN